MSTTKAPTAPPVGVAVRERLELRLFGAPEIMLDGRRLGFDTRKAVALIAYLAVTGRRHTREDLAQLLWPESDRTRSRSALRRTLFTAAAAGPALLVDRAGVELDVARSSCDVSDFVRDVDDGLAGARRAVNLYRADFLEGFTLRDSNEFEEWRAGIQERLVRDLDRCLALLVDDAVAGSDLEAATGLARRRIELDPLNEGAHQTLIALYDWAGRRSDSLRQYRTCVRVLDRELGVTPLPETTAVYDAVRRRRLPPPTPGPPRTTLAEAEAEAEAEAAAQASAAGHDRVEIFVGRSVELQALAMAWSRAERSGGALAVVGEVGTGKTALIGRFAAEVATQGGLVVRARGHEGEQYLAYGAVTDLARALTSLSPISRGGLDPEQGEVLRWLAPGGPAPAGAGPADRGRIFDAVRSALSQVRASSPDGLLVVVEDIHWLDAESRDLVAYLVRRPVVGILLALTWRGASAPAPVAAAMADALGEETGDIVRLAPLPRSDVAGLLAAFGHPVDEVALDDAVLHTGGLPLLISERARLVPGAAGGSPGGADSLVRARIDAAPETTQQVVTAIAVVATPMDPELVRAVSGRSDHEVVSALEDAVARGLLVELAGRAEYEIPHDTLRRIAVEQTSLARRRLLHGRAADALSGPTAGRAQREPGRSASVARHLELAGRTDQAAAWHARAAEEASSVFAHATAEAHLAAALALGHDPSSSHLGIGDAQVRLGRYAAALESYEAAAAEAAGNGALATVERRLAAVRLRLGEPALSQGHLEAALDLLEEVDPADPGRAVVLADLALVDAQLGRREDARARAVAAIDAAAQDEPEAAAQAYDVLGVLAARDGDLELARTHLATSLDHARRLPDPSAAVAALNNLARIEAEAGRLPAALEAAAAALASGEAYGDTHRTAALHDNLADLLHRAGRDEEAREHQRQAAALFAAVDRGEERRPEIWKLVEW